ncbi:MAG: glutamyl-tRNA reductase [Planctomycetota bacterium]
MNLQIIGCSHHKSSVDIRERLAFDEEHASRFLEEYYLKYPQSEAVLISTCNRTEFLTASQDKASSPTATDMQQLLADACGIQQKQIQPFLFDLANVDAIRHLFSVAASLDSMVVGETQILNQIKAAYQLASSINDDIPLTHQIFQTAIRVAKRVTTETDIHNTRVSIPSIAIGDFARQIFERFDNKRILVLGAGEMAEETLQYVSYYGGQEIFVANRTADRAKELCDRCGGQFAEWIDLPHHLQQADLIISTTGATEPIVTESCFLDFWPSRSERTLFILDLAVPRDFDHGIGKHENVFLYSIDDLQAQCNHNRQSRKSNWPKAKKIIDQETDVFMKEMAFRSQGPTIARLKEQASSVKDAELKRLFNKLGEIEPEHRQEIETAFHRLTNKLLHPPLESLRQEAETDQRRLFDAIKQLFKLGD